MINITVYQNGKALSNARVCIEFQWTPTLRYGQTSEKRTDANGWVSFSEATCPHGLVYVNGKTAYTGRIDEALRVDV